jgi:hypothetical protein
VALLCYQDVVGLQISVDVVLGMNKLHGMYQFAHVETSLGLWQDVFHDQQIHQIASWKELHDEVQEQTILEGVAEVHYRVLKPASTKEDVSDATKLEQRFVDFQDKVLVTYPEPKRPKMP